MLRKKVTAAGLSILLAMSMFTVPAFAHGHHSVTGSGYIPGNHSKTI